MGGGDAGPPRCFRSLYIRFCLRVCGFCGNYGVEVVFYASCEQQASEALVEFA